MREGSFFLRGRRILLCLSVCHSAADGKKERRDVKKRNEKDDKTEAKALFSIHPFLFFDREDEM